MNTAFYTASQGTIQIQKGLDVIANNIANVSTTGYKTQEYNFSDMLYSNIYNDESLTIGHGSKLISTNTLFAKGTLVSTGRNLDYAITDENGFFATLENGQISYTRDGNFYLSEKNGNYYLTSKQGAYVLDSNFKQITVDPSKVDSTKINVGVFSFSNLDGLIRNSDGSFVPTNTSGKAMVVSNPNVENGSLESSSVDVVDEMAALIEIQRAFQVNAKMVQIADEVAQTMNSVR